MIFTLSIFLGLLSVFNKISLFLERKSGWISGIVIGATSGFYFFAIGLKILAVAEFGFFLVMVYGFVRRTKPSLQITFWVNLILSLISISLCYFMFIGLLTLIETISALSFIWGGYQLAINKKVSGWFLLLCAHIATAITSFYASQTIFSALQVISGLVCIYAVIVTMKSNSQESNKALSD
jgi:hypothetical protein